MYFRASYFRTQSFDVRCPNHTLGHSDLISPKHLSCLVVWLYLPLFITLRRGFFFLSFSPFFQYWCKEINYLRWLLWSSAVGFWWKKKPSAVQTPARLCLLSMEAALLRATSVPLHSVTFLSRAAVSQAPRRTQPTVAVEFPQPLSSDRAARVSVKWPLSPEWSLLSWPLQTGWAGELLPVCLAARASPSGVS